MKTIGILLAYMALVDACLESAASVTIQNYEGPIYITGDHQIYDNNRPPVYDNRPPTLPNLAPTCDQPILHTYATENDCKCLTKQITPIYTGISTSITYPQYPEVYYACSDQCDQNACPKISDTLIPLLKTYLCQNTCPKHGCQYGQTYQYHS